MLTVYKRDYYTNVNVEIGCFDNINDIYNHFRSIYYIHGSSLAELFSHNPFDYRLVVENYNGVRYSRDTLLGNFRAISKKQKERYSNYFYGFKRHNRSHYHRRPKTISERRASVSVIKEEGEPIWRYSRNHHNLPTTYDDLTCRDTYNRNWKRYRKKQYKN